VKLKIYTEDGEIRRCTLPQPINFERITALIDSHLIDNDANYEIMYFNTDQEFQAMNSDRDLLEALTIMKETYQKYLKLQIYHPGDQIQLSFP
jgi:hypothetical protein